MYACIHSCMHACIHAHIHAKMYAYIHICLHTHTLGQEDASFFLQVLPDQWHREGTQLHPQLRAAQPRQPQVIQLCRGWKVSWRMSSDTTLYLVIFPTLCRVLTSSKLLYFLKFKVKFQSFQNMSSKAKKVVLSWLDSSVTCSRHSCFLSCIYGRKISASKIEILLLSQGFLECQNTTTSRS